MFRFKISLVLYSSLLLSLLCTIVIAQQPRNFGGRRNDDWYDYSEEELNSGRRTTTTSAPPRPAQAYPPPSYSPEGYYPPPEQPPPQSYHPQSYPPQSDPYQPRPPHQQPRVYAPVPLQPAPPAQNSDVILVPRLGLVRGKVNYKVIGNRGINSFLGLKYGTVGKGLERFQPAHVPEYTSNDVIDATREPENCPQFPDLDKIEAAAARGENVDDCLTLNVHAPNQTGSYPVLVFIHGEMLFDGSAEEGQPDYFLEHDVVLVSVNYRLAPFGFLTTLTEGMPGNIALDDIKMALEWVQQYIRAFNGDPQQVTLFGQAGGATLVHALAISGKASELFHKLILHSGTALNPYFLEEDPLTTVRSFARMARCPLGGRENENINSCFERMSTVELLRLFKKHWEENEPRGIRFTGGFKLVVGDKLGYLPQTPAALVANNTYPTIVGVAKDAGAFIMSRIYQQLSQLRSRNISDYVTVILRHTAQPRHFLTWKNWALREIFTPEDAKNPTLNNLAQGLLELTNLILYRSPVIDSIRFTFKKHPTFLYCFDYRGEFHRFGHLTNPLPFESDATLSDDSIYLFPYPEEVSRLNPEDKTISRAIVTMWVNFARYNEPNLNAGIWPNVSTEVGPFVRITNSKEKALELDHHFGEGIPVPNLYPEYFTTTSTTRRPTTYPANQPNYPQNQPNYPPNQTNYPPNQPNYPPNQPNYPPNQPSYRPNQPNYPNYPNYASNQPPRTDYSNYPSNYPNRQNYVTQSPQRGPPPSPPRHREHEFVLAANTNENNDNNYNNNNNNNHEPERNVDGEREYPAFRP